jgi:hypothetical protein
MQTQIDNLQRQIDELKKSLSDKDMPMELREIMRNEVIKDQLAENQATTTVTMSPGGDITFPTPMTGVIILKWKGKEYKVPYYV